MLVMKFGGTSVGDAARIRDVIEIVRGRLARRPVVVVSAQSGVTNELIALAESAAKGETPAAALRARFDKLLADLALPADLVEEELDELDALLKGITLVGDLTPRSLDRMMSFGERCSARIVAAAMTKAGIPSAPHMAYDVGLLTDSNYGAAAVEPSTWEDIPRLLGPRVAKGETAVVTGFIARDKDGFLTTLGRGGSDYSAAIFGAALAAEEIEIWTDVDGVMSADPRAVPAATSLDTMSFAEAAELAYYGAKVIHPATIQPAVAKNIPIRVLNTFRPQSKGTLILASVADVKLGVRSIASKSGITTIHVTSHRMLLQHGFMARLFQVFERHRVVIDMVSTSEVSVSVTTDNPRDLEALTADLRAFAEVRVEAGRSILCLVGDRLHDLPEVMERIFRTLREASIPVRMVSVGASRINVSLVVDQPHATNAVKALHRAFFGA
jgi:aspartate kinase